MLLVAERDVLVEFQVDLNDHHDFFARIDLGCAIIQYYTILT